ncbi:hypothetical protein PRK78_002790 [Emydomyces testavorans]|uniref:Uncharacterized protein n=1 Tax=Emydomyces testavorans TaxID=2070801 RepID=A0AAF0IGV1_9EURO|nr:hypothetical protein PRK78_002790 [Emydomyces testavorans]
MSFSPKGLIRTKSMEVLWNMNQSAAIAKNEALLKQSQLWELILRDNFRPDDGFDVSPQSRSRTRGTDHFVVSRKTPAATANTRALLIVVVPEAPLDFTMTPMVFDAYDDQLKAMEARLRGYCSGAVGEDQPFVYGLATSSSKGRMFRLDKARDELIPVSSAFEAESRMTAYKDARDERVWNEAFQLVKSTATA